MHVSILSNTVTDSLQILLPRGCHVDGNPVTILHLVGSPVNTYATKVDIYYIVTSRPLAILFIVGVIWHVPIYFCIPLQS